MDKCRILFLAANPQGTTPLALDHEIRAIEDNLQRSEHRDTLELISKWALRPDDLLQLLNQYKPHVVHFSGHGSKENEIVLLSEADTSQPVSSVALGELFRTLKDNIRLVVLNACFSRGQAEAVVKHIDCAVGMNKAIGDQAAITFAASLYRAIGFGRSVKEAFDQGKAALMLDSIPEEKTPELLCRSDVDPSDVILIPEAASPHVTYGGSEKRNIAEAKSGGFHFGHVGRDVKIEAVGDIVAGDKVTTTHNGFNDVTQKQEFLKQMDELRSALREIKSQVEGVEHFDEDARDELVMEILQQLSEVKQAKQDAEQLVPGQLSAADRLQSVGQCLDKTGGLLDKIKAIGASAAGIAETVAPVLAKALPILASARHLLGVP